MAAWLVPAGIPVFLAVAGIFDAEWRLAVACRNARIYTIKASLPLSLSLPLDCVVGVRPTPTGWLAG